MNYMLECIKNKRPLEIHIYQQDPRAGVLLQDEVNAGTFPELAGLGKAPATLSFAF